MKIGVVADTHSRALPKPMLNDFKRVDFIIHAGDFCSLDVAQQLKKIKDVKGVYGNMDDQDIRKAFPRRQLIKVGSVTIGVVHGNGPSAKIFEVVKNEFQTDKVDAVIFGHSHQALNETKDNVLYFNPGSPNDTMFAPYCSYGILEIADKDIKGKIIKVKGS